MAITIAGIRFDFHDYDEHGDTLFLSVKKPDINDPRPADTYDTPEGHFVELDESGSVRAIELMNPRWLLARNRRLRLTLRERPTVECTADLAPLLAQGSTAQGR